MYARRRADPVRHARFLKRHAEAQVRYRKRLPARVARERRRAQYVKLREAAGVGVIVCRREVPAGRRLPREPFRRWLMSYGRLMQLSNATQLAEDLGVEERGLRRVLKRDQATVCFDVVDAALVNAREPVRVKVGVTLCLVTDVFDLYPVELADVA